MASQKKHETTTYTYQFQDGETTALEAGKEGVTEELILFLQISDNEMKLQTRYQRENESYTFQNAMRFHCSHPDTTVNPIECFPDPKADIFKILFSDEKGTSKDVEMVNQIMTSLTENQRDLIWEAYGMLRGDTEIAREQNVTREAIQNRRKKIMRRVEKLLQEQKP